MARRIAPALADLGPGLILAATGIGVGDMVSATIAGAEYGVTLIWALAAGVVVKFAITEGAASTYAYLQNSKTTIITTDDHDVFGDGTVVIKSSPGHTPGHQVLYLKLAKTGGVVLSGDLYHYPEERTLNRLPVADFDQEQTRRSREAPEAFLKQTGAQLWIQHDLGRTPSSRRHRTITTNHV